MQHEWRRAHWLIAPSVQPTSVLVVDATGCHLTFSSILAAFLAATPPVLAHHSFAMFDNTKEVELVGEVREFQWTNPHIWIQLAVNENGKTIVYSIEGSSPNGLSRRGWKRTTFKPGGSFERATGADGTTVNR